MSRRFRHAALVGKYHAQGIRDVLDEIARFLIRQKLDVSLERETALNTGLNDYGALTPAQLGEQCDIAIVVGGLGLSQSGTQRALDTLPEDITLAFAANGNSLFRWMPVARKGGHEILLQVPLEPFDYPDNNPGRLTLVSSDSAAINLKRLHEAMGRMTNYTGVMNYLGGRFLAAPDALEPVMQDISKRGLLFLDDGSSAQSLSGTYAKTFGAPHAFADVVLDQEVSKASVLKKLDELERIALRKGSAIGVASAFDESVDAVTEWAKEAQGRGIEIVGVSVLADVPN